MSVNKHPEANLLRFNSIWCTQGKWMMKCEVHSVFDIQRVFPRRYRTLFKPQYKIGYKTITELEWRCCPGYSGENCFDGPTSDPDAMMPPFKGSFPRPGVKGYPWGHPRIPFPEDHPNNKPIPSGFIPPETPKTSYGKCKLHISHLAIWLLMLHEHCN